MIKRIQAKNYRCLRYIDQSVHDFHILVGPNASGKSTFVDVVAFLSDLLSEGLESAIRNRSVDFRDLLFSQQGDRFELAVEWAIPEKRITQLPDNKYDTIRYEVSIGIASSENEVYILDEQVILLTAVPRPPRQRDLVPLLAPAPVTILSGTVMSTGERVVRRVCRGNDNFSSEVSAQRGKGGWSPSYRLGPTASALGT